MCTKNLKHCKKTKTSSEQQVAARNKLLDDCKHTFRAVFEQFEQKTGVSINTALGEDFQRLEGMDTTLISCKGSEEETKQDNRNFEPSCPNIMDCKRGLLHPNVCKVPDNYQTSHGDLTEIMFAGWYMRIKTRSLS